MTRNRLTQTDAIEFARHAATTEQVPHFIQPTALGYSVAPTRSSGGRFYTVAVDGSVTLHRREFGQEIVEVVAA